MNLELTGRRALVGGATSGLGLATARALAREGCSLVLWSRDQMRLDQVAVEIAEIAPVTISTIAWDAADTDAAHHVAEAALRGGPVDIAILNGGGPPPVNPTETTADGWWQSLQMLTVTPIMLATALIPSMRARGFGRIIAVLSSGVVEPIPALAYSNAARSALAAWLKTVSREVAAEGITVNGVMPGRIDTPRVEGLDAGLARSTGRSVADIRAESQKTIPAGRYGTAEEFGTYVTMLSSPLFGYVTGQLHAVDGGMLKSV